MLCSEPVQRRRPSAASTKGGGLRPPPFVVSFVLALSKAHVLALNTAHVLRLNKADVLALNKAHVLRLNKASLYTHLSPKLRPMAAVDIYIYIYIYLPGPFFGQVVFLGKIKECLACKKSNKEDNIQSKVTWEGLKQKSDFSLKVSRHIVKMQQKRWFW